YVLERSSLTKPDRVTLSVLGTPPDPVRTNPASETPAECHNWEQWLNIVGREFPKELAEEIEATTASTNAPDKEVATQFGELKTLLHGNKLALAWMAPRGIGLTAWKADARKQVQIRRRFMLLGQTLESARVWDIRRGIQAL